MEEAKPQGEEKQAIPELTPEQIRALDPAARATLCSESINEILHDFHCVFNPVAHISNLGTNIQVRVVAMAYPVMPEVINPLQIN